MKRFRITILAICLVLAWLGYSDLSVLLRNPEPLAISLAELEISGAPREWLRISDGTQDLLQAINMSGTIEIGSFLVPLKQNSNSEITKVWFETRDPVIIEALKTYYFMLDTDKQRQQFLNENIQLFYKKRPVTGMTADNLVSSSNQKKLSKLLQQMNVPVTEDTLFISEGKQPARWRGIFFVGIALVGLVKIFLISASPYGNKENEK
ncbi:MAG: hypothetical protein OQK50_06465 [Deltaproteobacteria bacterium]|jgi:hypothetical protein|nr:hypothetical protein [Deltaproteobacteria bacterium]MCW8892578.1 hypothetical protein [Deltaproteobacteria bacterium]MCW9049954.1 hypothetical protein [Deltaproteobacteria bacterium]